MIGVVCTSLLHFIVEKEIRLKMAAWYKPSSKNDATTSSSQQIKFLIPTKRQNHFNLLSHNALYLQQKWKNTDLSGKIFC